MKYFLMETSRDSSVIWNFSGCYAYRHSLFFPKIFRRNEFPEIKQVLIKNSLIACRKYIIIWCTVRGSLPVDIYLCNSRF